MTAEQETEWHRLLGDIVTNARELDSGRIGVKEYAEERRRLVALLADELRPIESARWPSELDPPSTSIPVDATISFPDGRTWTREAEGWVVRMYDSPEDRAAGEEPIVHSGISDQEMAYNFARVIGLTPVGYRAGLEEEGGRA